MGERTSHEQDGVDAEEPVLLEHLAGLVQEDPGLVLPLRAASGSLGLGTKEDLALREERAEDTREGRDAGGAPEEGTPGLLGLGDKVEVDDGGDEVADGVALLEDARRETTRLYGQCLEGGRGSHTPDTAHGDTEDGADTEELLEGLDEARAELDDADDGEVGDERPLAAIAVRDDAENDLMNVSAISGGVYVGRRKIDIRRRRNGRGG